MKNYKILFVSHDASRTGAPIVLLNLLSWLKQNSSFDISILIINDGHILPRFKEITPVYVWNRNEPEHVFKRTIRRIVEKIAQKTHEFNPNQKKILKTLKKKRLDLIYINTVASHSMIPILIKENKCPVISHIHEMPFSIKAFYPNSMDNQIISQIDHFICVSEIAKMGLKKYWDISDNKISLFNEFINTSQLKSATISKSEIQNELKIKNSFIIGGSGTFSWRKGVDLFIDLGRILKNKEPLLRINLVWVGDLSKEVTEGYLYENNLLGVTSNIIFTGGKDDPQNYFQTFDIFVLTSREDPFPLVCIEAASLGKPIICFENASGIPELLNKDCGIVIPYRDIDEMANKIIELYHNRKLLSTFAERISKRSLDYDVNKIAPRIHTLINEMIELQIKTNSNLPA